ncbi:MAG: aldo/keto reductase [Nanoarchaeota archaeon]|nr:aldo/keto reductase [Nanoarchaeota archaeon]
MNHITLQSGHTIPQVGFGTWQVLDSHCTQIVLDAIKIGYTHIDTAQRYSNHKDIAKAIEKVPRETLFITSKVWRDDLSYQGVLTQVDQILDELKIEYLDLCLIHWPNRKYDIKDTFQALEYLVKVGKIKSVGVSNFTIKHIQETLKVSNIPISVNQIEFHYKLQQYELLEFCKEHNIVVEAYSPLARGEFLEDERILKLAQKYDKSPSQILLRWLVEKNIVVLPKTSQKSRLKENLSIFNFQLSKEDHELINSLNENKRIINPHFADFEY